MDKNEKVIYYERKIIAYEQMLNTYWEITSQIMEGSITALEYFKILKGTMPALVYGNFQVIAKKEVLEPMFLELAKIKKTEDSTSYTKVYNKLNKAFNDLIIAVREDLEGAKNDSSISEAADR